MDSCPKVFKPKHKRRSETTVLNRKFISDAIKISALKLVYKML